MKYSVVIERMEIIEVDANNEEQAIIQVRNQLVAQNSRDISRISVATEVTI